MSSLRKNQGGVMLLEAMIGILIFSLGVLALVAMQAVSIGNVSNAQYRSEAAFLANEIISKAWVGQGVNSVELVKFKYPGPGTAVVTDWVNKVQTTLPQASTYPPTIVQTPIPGVVRGAQITVTIQWKAPDALVPSNHVAIAYVSSPADPS